MSYKEFMTFEEFKNVELRVATILEALPVENSLKLLKLKISLGDTERQIVAGIGHKYKCDFLIGVQIIIVANLEPKKLMGELSEGMLLAAHDEENSPILISPISKAPDGDKIS